MFEENFALIIAIVALIYAFAIRKLQYTYGNQKEMETFQKEMKGYNEEYKKASQEKNQARMEATLKKQQEVFPKMGKLMLGQFKVMGIVLIIFLGMMWVIDQIDPFKADDVFVELVDDGSGCDSSAGDMIYSGCYKISSTNYGPWMITVNAYEGTNVFAQNSTSFLHREGSLDDPLFYEVKGEPLGLTTDKQEYNSEETVKITANPSKKPERMEAVLNNGTWFYVDLPFTIPILNVQRIQQPYWWFITISVLSGLIITPIYKKLQKRDNDAVAKE